jgi:hypothetical protein
LALLWQIRHTITHNSGVLTESDAAKLRLLVKVPVAAGVVLTPTKEDIRYMKRFLVEAAQQTNGRIGRRLAQLLTEILDGDATLFDAQDKANTISRQFGIALTVKGKVGRP